MIRGEDAYYLKVERERSDREIAAKLEENLVKWNNEIDKLSPFTSRKSNNNNAVMSSAKARINTLLEYANEAERRLEPIYKRLNHVKVSKDSEA